MFQKMHNGLIYTEELVSVEYLFKHALKVISSGIINAKLPYLDLFCCLETFKQALNSSVTSCDKARRGGKNQSQYCSDLNGLE
jgi:hypothetical protein